MLLELLAPGQDPGEDRLSSPNLADWERWRHARNIAAAIAPGSAADRITMIPLIICPHDWQVLDANIEIHSTRYATQSSCMGLYPRYQALARDGRGAWFAARTGAGRLVGLSSARLGESGSCLVDGFTLENRQVASVRFERGMDKEKGN